MIISYSKHGKSGGVDYAIKNDTARVLEGDPKLTKSLIKQSKNKLKYRSGIISFEEKHPPKEVIQDVIAEFKRSTFAGLDQEQYNLLLVEHTNTDNYHIHFTILRVELTSGKSFNPHWHQEDQTRLLKLQDYLNAKHGLSNPYQADKRSTLESIDTKALNRNQTKEEINKHIEELVIVQKLQNRDEVVEYFKSSGIDVVRQSKNFITVQLDDERIRLKGEYYAETFKDIGAITAKLERAEREHIPTTQRQLTELKQELDRLIQYKANTNRERYPKIERNYDREFGLRARDVKKEQDLQVHSNSNVINDNRNISNVVSNETVASTKRATSRAGQQEVHLSADGQADKQREKSATDKIYTNRGGIEDDITRENTSRRARGREEIQQRTLSGTKAEPNGVYRGVAKNFNSVREHHKTDKERLREPAGELEQEIGNLHEQRSSGISNIKERVGTVVNQAKEYIEIAKAKAKEVWQKLQESLERQKAIEKEQQQSHSRGFSLGR